MVEGPRPRARLRAWLAGGLAGVIGLGLGVGIYTVSYADGPSYLGSDPKTCANCHVMNKQYDSWRSGPHANVATCNDCHLPHDSVIAKYAVKAEDGVLHVSKFTLDTYPENIKIRQKSLEVVNRSCLECHGELTADMRAAMGAGQELSCVRCHENVGH